MFSLISLISRKPPALAPRFAHPSLWAPSFAPPQPRRKGSKGGNIEYEVLEMEVKTFHRSFKRRTEEKGVGGQTKKAKRGT